MDTVTEVAREPLMSDEPRQGYLMNQYGRYSNPAGVRPERLAEHYLVEELIGEALEMQGLLALFKAKVFDRIETFRQEVAARYDAKFGGVRGGLTVRNFSDTLRVSISQGDTMTFGPELEAAKSLIDECLQDWTSGGNANVQMLVNDAFHVGENKRVRIDRVLGLRRLNITGDDRWDRAMLAITDALQVERSKLYVRFYRREKPEDTIELIVLDLARV